jgi:chromosome segregation ATPase
MYKKFEQNEVKVKNQQATINELVENKQRLEKELTRTVYELSEVKSKFESSANLIQHTFKTGALLKEEKESLETILKDNAVKLRSMKEENDKLSEAYSKLEAKCFDGQGDLELANRKINELKKLNEILDCEKETCVKETNHCKTEMSDLQAELKATNKKIHQITTEKDAQIQKLEQSISCKMLSIFIYYMLRS